MNRRQVQDIATDVARWEIGIAHTIVGACGYCHGPVRVELLGPYVQRESRLFATCAFCHAVAKLPGLPMVERRKKPRP